jgi:PKD repeat protein
MHPKNKILITLLTLLFLSSCLKEEMLVAKSDFTFQIKNSNNASFITFSNLSSGGETFEWIFEGGLPATSSQFNPGEVKYTLSGTYNITLKVSNKDGSVSELVKTVSISGLVKANFTSEILINDYAPVEVKLTNISENATQFDWVFSNGNPPTSTSQNPNNVIFNTVGSHAITLTAKNSSNETSQKTINVIVKPSLTTSLTTTVDPIDSDYEVPVTIKTNNTTISATSYNWEAIGANPSTSSAVNPDFVYSTAGTYDIKLTATNGKQTQTVVNSITVYPNSNLSTQNDIKLGINTAHSNVGSFYSTKEKRVYKQNEVNNTNGQLIDLVFFGLNATFSNNRFLSPTDAGNYTFSAIPNATQTNFINKQEDCACGSNFTTSQFDSMTTDALLQNITVANQNISFNNSVLPRIIPFKTQDGRSGLIKLKSFVADGLNSYIMIDLKVQK